MKNTFVVFVAAGLVLAGCQSNQATAPSASPSPENDSTVSASQAPVQAAAPTRRTVQGAPTPTRMIEISANTKYDGKDTPAKCTLQSEFDTITITTPTKVALPDYSTKSPTYDVVCVAPGAIGRSKLEPKSVQQREAVTVGFLVGGAIGASLARGIAPEEGSKFTYPKLYVRMQDAE